MEKKDIEDSYIVLFFLPPKLLPHVDVVDNQIPLAAGPWGDMTLSHPSAFRGHKPNHEMVPGITTCDFSSKRSEWRKEIILYL